MQAEIVDKRSGSRRHAEDTLRVALDRPSVVFLKLAPENVARYQRRGDDLVLVLKDGREVVIPGFFVKYQEGAEQAPADAKATADGTPAEEGRARNELVLEDDNGVAWWGQYPEQWSEFHFTEIELDDGGLGGWPWLLGALGAAAAGGGALAGGGFGGGGGGGGGRGRPPVAIDDNASGPEDSPIAGHVLTNDSDPDGDPLTVTTFRIAGDPTTYNAGDTVTIPDVGTFTLGRDGTYIFTPEPNWNGTVPTVTYTVSDGKGGTDTADLVITVTPVPDLTAADDSATTEEDTPVDGTVATNDTTTSGGTLTFGKASDPSHGSVDFHPDGTYTYTPDPDYHGPDSFTYTVTDPASGESLTRTVNITVTPVNDAPVAEGTIPGQESEDAQNITPVDVTSYFSDVDTGDTLTYSAIGLPEGLEIDPVTGIISGIIDRSASQDHPNGEHSVTVRATDGSGAWVDQTFTWTVTNPPPVGMDDEATTEEDMAVSGNVLTGLGSGDVADTDQDGDPLSVTTFTIAGDPTIHDAGDLVTIPDVGTFTLGSDGSYTFTPDANWNGTVPTVTYTVDDGEGGSDTADLVITVTPVNDAPVAEGTIPGQESEDAENITPVDVTSYFSDVDTGDTLTYSAIGLPEGLEIDPVTGIISGIIDRSASQDHPNGEHSVTVRATDGSNESVDQIFTWTVTNPPPVGMDDTATTEEDMAVSGNVLTGLGSGDVADTDQDGDPLSVTTFTIAGDPTIHDAGDLVTIPDIGTFTLGSDGGYTFTPDADWNGTVPTVTYTVDDGEGGSDTADLVITVTPVNDAPVAEGAIPGQESEDAENITPVDVTSYFSDVDTGDTLTYSAIGLPEGLEIDPVTGVISGIIDRSASQDNGGLYSVTVTATDGSNESVDQVFAWTVTNPPPVGMDDEATTEEDMAVSGNVLTGLGSGDVADTDQDGDPLSVTTFTIAGDPTIHDAGDLVTIPDIGTFTLGSDGGYTFTPDADWNGTVPTVTYTVDDGEGGSDTADLVITVTPVNDAPVAEGAIPGQESEDAENITPVDVTSYFSDVDTGDTLTYSAIGLPEGLEIDPVTGVISGIIDRSASQDNGGLYSVTVTATDGSNESVDQVFAWTVTNPPPVGMDDEATTEEDMAVSGNVLTGLGSGDVADTDQDGDPLTVTTFTIAGDPTIHDAGDLVTIPDVGTFTLGSDGGYTFTPDANWNGTVPTVTYTVDDGEGGSDTADLVITVTPVNDAPVAEGAIPGQESEDAQNITPVDVTSYFSDVDTGDTLTYSAIGLPEGLEIDPVTGVISGIIDRSASQDNGGLYSVTVTATDGSNESVDQIFTWTVTNPPPVGMDDEATTEEDMAVSGNVLTGLGSGDVADTDQDGDPLSVTTFTIAGDPTIHDAGDLVTIPDIGTFTLGSDGGYTFTPDANWNGTVPTVTYTVDDGEGGSDTADLVITVTPVNDAPVAEGTIPGQESEDAENITPVDVTSYFSDVDTGDTLTYSAIGLPEGLEIDPVTGVISGIIDRSASQDNGGLYSVTVTATDGSNESVDQVFAWTVTNPPPVGMDDEATTEEDMAVSGNVLTGLGSGDVADTDQDGDPLSVTTFIIAGDPTIHDAGDLVTIPDIGTFTLGSDGGYTFTPDANWNGTVPTVTYTVDDGEGGTDTADLVITVTPVPDLTAEDDSTTTEEDTPVNGTVVTNDSTTSGGTLTFAKASDPSHGSVDFNTDGTYTYTPDPNYNGPDSFTYTVTDPASGESLTRTVNITVTPVNDPPVAEGTIPGQESEDAENITPVDVTSYFSDVDTGDTLTYSAIGLPEGLEIDPVTGVISGIIDRSASQDNGGLYSVTVTATDGSNESVDQVFAWTVTNPPPVGMDDEATTEEDTAVSGNVLTGLGSGDVADTDQDGDPLSVTTFTIAGDPTIHDAGDLVTIPDIGTFTLGSDGGYTFTPDADWNGTVPTVTYTVDDGEGGSDTADLVITVTPVNDAPVIAGGNQSDDVVEAGNLDDGTPVAGTPTASGSFSATDVDNDTLAWSVFGTPDTTYGQFDIDSATGEWTFTLNNDLPATQALNEDDTVDVTYTVQVSDGAGGTATRTVTITITGTNDSPVANADTGAVTESGVSPGGNTPTAGTATATGNVLTNDTDVDDGEQATLTVSEVSFGVTPGTVGASLSGAYGSLVLNSTGGYTYTLDNENPNTQALKYNQSVTEVFTYTTVDVNGATSTSTLTITVTGTNDRPVITSTAAAAEGEVTEQGVANPAEPATASGTLTASDVDVDATQNWTIVSSTNGTYGQIAINSATGEWTYTLRNDWDATQALNQGDTATDTFTARVTDENGAYSEQVITVTVTGSNDAPVANADTGAVTEAGVSPGGNTPTAGTATATGNVLTNDTDVDDGEQATLTVSEVSFGVTPGTVGASLSGAYGSLVLNSTGGYTYTLDNENPNTQALKYNQSVTEVFTYTTVDVNGATSTSTLTITVTGTNDRPVITSTTADAEGEVTEQGTANPAEPATVSGTLTASDVDVDATQNWTIVSSTNGTYGQIAINSATGEWTYTLRNDWDATQALNQGDTETDTFTARVTDENGAYSEQVITVTVHGSNDVITGSGDEIVTLVEDGQATGTLQDYVEDMDDTLTVTGFRVDADGDGTDENYDAGDTVTLRDSANNELGTLTIEENGDYTFIPAPNYAGNVPTVTYTMTESVGSQSVTQTVDFEITKKADAPDLEANKTVNTTEDNSVSLDLIAPVITDTGTGTGNNDHPERLGAITLTIAGAGATGVTLETGATILTPVGGTLTIVLTDVPHVTSVPAEDNANGVYYLTTDEYEALIAHPPAESGRDFTVTVSATSYEVDSGGVIIPSVTGATNTQVIDVDVQAVTDGATLASSVSDLTLAEDSTVNLSQYLTATLNDTDFNSGTDTDGSETYWYTVSGLPIGTVVTINGVATTITASVTSASSSVSTSATPPTITVRPPVDYSGDIENVTITLYSKDTDSDSSGTPATLSSPITLDLHVTPAAGDVSVSEVTTAEDTAVAFLASVTVTDTGSGGTGTEVIDQISFEVPTGWVVTAPAPSAGWTYDLDGTTATIEFDDTLDEAAREAVLDQFLIKPPPHSSADETITLSITTTDSNTVDGSPVTDTQTVSRDVEITVTPVAERTDVDSDGAGGNDVTMNGDHAYSIAGAEDMWFALGTNYTDVSNVDGGYAGLSDWSNADADEFTYAVLTPTLDSATPGDTVVGTQFRYSTDGGTTWQTQTYVGEPIWVPAVYLDTLQVKLPANVAGTLTLGVQAGTVDYDDDTEVVTLPLDPPHTSGPGVNVTVSGSATLSFVEFEPVADELTMALNGRATGFEDTAIPLAIKTTSSDPSEVFDVTISGIPAGAKIIYNGVEQTVTSGSVTIPGFDNATPLTITPPLNSNNDFVLTVTAVSVDGSSISAPVSRTIDVSVTGVADDAIVTLAPAYNTTEAALDSGAHAVALSSLVTSVASSDTDGSEVATLRITGLAEGFSVTGATMVTSGTGTERVWTVPADKLANVSIILPANYSGTVNFKVAGVTTENDGDSKTGSLIDVGFTVTPSPEGTITTSATLVEDQITPLNLAIVHQNGDANETLGKIYIAADYATDADYTLHLNGVALEAAGIGPITISDVTGIPDGDYYVVPADQVGGLGARGAPHLDGDLGSLDILYEVVDPSNDGTLPEAVEIKSATITLDATPVTDEVHASITGIAMGTATGTTEDVDPGDDAVPDTVTVTASGTVTVNLHVASDDTDGSERLIRVLIEDVPDGVTVTGASQVDGSTWLLIYDGGDAQSIGAGGIDVPVEFIVGRGASGTSTITMTVQAQDEGQSTATPAGIETDSVSWNLVLDLVDGGPYAPPVIDDWSYNGAVGTEDVSFTLDSVIDAAVSTDDPAVTYTYTVTITDLPAGSAVEGMTLTTIGGVPTWTATVTVPPGGDSQAALDGLLAGITITPPANSNDNNAEFSFDARLTSAAMGGTSAQSDANADMPVTPVTDGATITVTTSDVGEGTTSVTATIDAQVVTDGAYGQIVDGKLYVQVANSNNPGGTVTDGDGNTLLPITVTGVDDVPNGDYYVIDIGLSGGSVELTYTAAGGTLEPGDVTFTAYAQTQEVGASNVVAASASGTAAIEIINNGVVVAGNDGWTGPESAAANKDNAIELSGLSVTLNDDDGSESIQSILLSGVPVGFLLYVGSSPGDVSLATQATNAGGDGTTNTWVLSTDGTMPAYVAILPATNWSGTLDELALVVESGEASLPATRVDTIPLAPVTVQAVANGITIDPTLSFGREGRVIDLNLNAAMADAAAAIGAVPDGSRETTTLQIKGLGEHAAFYVGDDLITSSYDAATDTYTITGLSQDELDDLGFVQAVSALTDQDAVAGGLQVTVTAWTVERDADDNVLDVSAPVTDSLTLAMTPVLASTGNDNFIWGGAAIDGKAGIDTVALRHGEDLTNAELATLLKNIEVIDLSAPGANSITGGLSIADVLAITGPSNTLTINGDGDDAVVLSNATEWSTDGNATGGYVTYTGTSGVTLLIDEDIYNNNHVSYAA